MDMEKLMKKWEALLNEGTDITNTNVRKSTAIMLENQHNFINGRIDEDSTSYGSDSLGADTYATSGMFHKIAVPMVRRTFPELIAHDLVGVQPMTGPVGLAFGLRFRAGDSTSSGNYAGSTDVEIGHNTIDEGYTGQGTYSSASASGTGLAVATGEALGSSAGTGVGNDIGLGIGTGSHIVEVNMTVEKAQVEATTRKLRSRWSLEVAQDLKAMHGLNLEEEMMDILSYEITAEIDRELMFNISNIATNTTWNYAATAGIYQGRWELERYRELYHYTVRRANVIATNTRRGAGNFIVANPAVCAVYETLADFTIAAVNGDINTANTGVARVGSLGGRFNLYRDTFESTDQAIVGYKGASEYDTGIIYLPYVQLLQARATFEDSFNPAIGLMSRYAIHSHLFGAANYYQKITISNLP